MNKNNQLPKERNFYSIFNFDLLITCILLDIEKAIRKQHKRKKKQVSARFYNLMIYL